MECAPKHLTSIRLRPKFNQISTFFGLKFNRNKLVHSRMNYGKANNIVTIYWIAFAIGRLSGIFLTPFVTSWLYIIIDCAGSILSVAAIIGLDYLLADDASETAKESFQPGIGS